MEMLGRLLERLMGMRPNTPMAHGVALLCIFVATAVRLAVDPFIAGVVPYATFFPATLIAALAGGISAWVTAWLSGGLLVWYFIFQSAGSDDGAVVLRLSEIFSFGLYTVTCLILLAVALLLRTTLARLQASETRLRLAVEGGRLGTWEADLETGIIHCTGTEALAGPGVVPSGPFQDWMAFCHPDDLGHVAAVCREGLDGRRADLEAEFRIRQQGGGWRWVAGFGRVIRDEAGWPVRAAGVIQDIGRRKGAEEALQEAKFEAERASLAKSRFLAAASHDLRQPVQSLLLFFGLMKNVPAQLPSIQPVMDGMAQSLEALRTLLDSLLDVSRLDAGLVVAQPVELPLGTVMERVAAEYGPRAAAAGLDFAVVKTTLVVRTDPALFERMLRNLVENALRYTRTGGVVVGCRRRGNTVAVTVVDTGIGIPPERQEDVFEEFCQIANPERDLAKGLGLGLAVVRRLGRLLGHPVILRSLPGRGSNFTVVLPRITVQQQSPKVAPEEPAQVRGLVVVIDDDDLICQGLEAVLVGWGYRVLTCGSGKEALDKLAADRLRPDAILADYRLRDGETGLQAIQGLQRRFGALVPATIITGDTGPERLKEARRGGCQLLHKPVAPADLHRTVAAMLERTQQSRL